MLPSLPLTHIPYLTKQAIQSLTPFTSKAACFSLTPEDLCLLTGLHTQLFSFMLRSLLAVSAKQLVSPLLLTMYLCESQYPKQQQKQIGQVLSPSLNSIFITINLKQNLFHKCAVLLYFLISSILQVILCSRWKEKDGFRGIFTGVLPLALNIWASWSNLLNYHFFIDNTEIIMFVFVSHYEHFIRIC